MSPARGTSDASHRLRELSAELDAVAREIGQVGGRVRTALGGTATGADRAALAGLGRASSGARGAQRALSAAVTALQRMGPV